MDRLKTILTVMLIVGDLDALTVSLNGQWRGNILSSDTFFEASVPGGVFTDLEKAGLIGRNLEGFNDVRNRWVANESIAYITQVNVDENLLRAPHVVLTFHGLDTFAEIYVNGIGIAATSNMFLKYSFDVKNNLKPGKNELKVVFGSAVKAAEDLYNEHSKKYIVPPKCVPKEYNGECHVNFIRKMHASFGWDWGAAFPSMGIWRDVELQPAQIALVTEITTDIYERDNFWQVVVIVFFKTFGEQNTIIDKETNVECSLENLYTNKSALSKLIVSNNEANTSLVLNIPLNKVKRWWPNGYGEPQLYSLSVKVKTDSDVAEKELKIGFRTVKLVQERLEEGLSFYFTINGIPVFAKGSNWIPSSAVPENLSNEHTLRHLLKSSRDAHMNMMRVWGGGVYESDLFYSIADEYGIMVWQDFMFACNMYPTTRSFLANVKDEIVQNMRRLKHHPSIVLWAGNNENEAALYGNWYGTGSKEIYKRDYVKLYADVIKHEAEIMDGTRPFVVSSPSNGIYSEENNYTESNPYSNYYGDVHYYNYLRDPWDINQYPVTRFASEYGFQALPSIWTLMSAIEHPNDLQCESSFMEHRQHLPSGTNFMKLLISKNLDIPGSNNSLVRLMDYVYLSQVTQAVAVRIETELYRQMRSSFNTKNEGMTMGALYWQLNDVWQAPSWSSIDFDGRWKMLHYYAKDFFAPVIITPQLSAARELVVFGISDLPDALENLTAEILLYEWSTSKAVYTHNLTNLSISPRESKVLGRLWLDKFLEEAGCGSLAKAREHCLVEFRLKDASGRRIAPLNYVYPHALKEVALPRNDVKVKIEPRVLANASLSERDFEVEVMSNNLALFVWLELGNIPGQFSENGFHVLNHKKTIHFHSSQPVAAQEVTKNLVVTSLSRISDTNRRVSDVQVVLSELDKLKSIKCIHSRKIK
ncbi:beta-mannosidase [Copidosoma floridanum]|uniref:beta-mannosidase n=1 Tax=Copidosoma floridanum TaxID=29053 RepID=UPI0006C940D7|nr:beta-mannosidase [Copidosoma floridanum]XP_014205963.1 beta-mannosidase [Copidosoma floridanum]